MDCSLLVGIHNLDQAAKEQAVSPIVLLNTAWNCKSEKYDTYGVLSCTFEIIMIIGFQTYNAQLIGLEFIGLVLVCCKQHTVWNTKSVSFGSSRSHFLAKLAASLLNPRKVNKLFIQAEFFYNRSQI